MHNFINILKKETEKFVNDAGLILVDIKFISEKNSKILRVSLDGDVTLDKCVNISRNISSYIDSLPEDCIPYNSYSLEVTSLGIDRLLKTERDFRSCLSKLCKISTKTKDADGRKRYRGIISSVSSSGVNIFTEEENKNFYIEFKNIQKAQLDVKI